MKIISSEELITHLDWQPLIRALESMFRSGCEMPVRHHHTIKRSGQPDATMLLMPAWQSDGYIGVKLANVFPGNADKGLPAVSGVYLLSDGETGAPLALLEGGELTARRTAAASALAADYLAPKSAKHLLMVGTGRLSKNLVHAHSAVRDLTRITVWGRSLEKSEKVAAELRAEGFNAANTEDLAGAVAAADIVSCATLSREPLIHGEWLSPGTHVDLVGGFTPQMREVDDSALLRSRVFCDTRAGAFKEAGELVQPLEAGTIKQADILADLYDLTRGGHPGREAEDEITLFKSVGAALEDLAAARLAFEGACE